MKHLLNLIGTICLVFSFQFANAGTRQTDGVLAERLWKAIDLVSLVENLPLHKIDGDKDILRIDSINCVWENYTACSFFADINGKRDLVVTKDAAPKLVNALIDNGILQEQNNEALYTNQALCVKSSNGFTCEIQD